MHPGSMYFPHGLYVFSAIAVAKDKLVSKSCMQEPGRAERAFDRYDAATVLKKFYSIELDDLTAPPGVEIIDFLEASSSPLPWMTEEELGQYAEKFQKSSFTGPLNYYRMMDT